MPILDQIQSPHDLKGLSRGQLLSLAAEIRARIIEVVAANGGHLASNLGIVELTLLLHRVFDSPRDKIIFDVGHQCYVHKLVTGRRDRFATLRTLHGISGFPKRSESPHDAFDTGHSSTSISAALGMVIGRDLLNRNHRVVAVIGDGSMTGGMVWEAMNHAGQLQNDLCVVLNDNEMSISPNVGALSRYLNKVRMEPFFTTPKDYLEYVVKQIPGLGSRLFYILSRLEGVLKYLLIPGVLFEELGFKYLGPVDGSDLEQVERALQFARERRGPVLVHVLTRKGQGYKPAQDDLPNFHGVGPFEITTGQIRSRPAPPTYTAAFGRALVEVADRDHRVVAITAAMKEGTGLGEFASRFPDRFFDVGIAEQHAVTVAAGMAVEGLRPVVAIYSTFLQRSIDQVIHDVALMNLPVVFALDRGGLVGEDGPTHHGVFDLIYLRMIPNLICLAPRDEAELAVMLRFALHQDGPVAIRYPRGVGLGERCPAVPELIPGRAEVLREGDHGAVWALGSMVHPALAAADELAREGIELTIVNPRCLKPLDTRLIEQQCLRRLPIFTFEEGNLPGGFGSSVLEAAHDAGFTPIVHRFGLPDAFSPQGTPAQLRSLLRLDASGIAQNIRERIAQSTVTRLGAG